VTILAPRICDSANSVVLTYRNLWLYYTTTIRTAARTMQTATNSSFTSAPGYRARSTNWTSIRLLNVYRLGLSAIFFSQSFVSESPLLQITNHRLYTWVSSAFLLLSLVWLLAAWIERRKFQQQITLQVYGDTIIIILLMHACGGISSGLGMLLIISIAVTGLLVEKALAIIFASLASLGLLTEYIYSSINLINYSGNSTQVGILGASLFATAIVTHKLTERIRSSEQLVQQGERDVALLSALNQEIIENLQAGVIVLTQNNQIRHINNTALKMLNITIEGTFRLKRDQPKIWSILEKWRRSLQSDAPYLPSETGLDNIQIGFRRLLGQGQEYILIFLNDVTSIKNSMQQAKLASLGHLTASIAHEIRNPLGAISHAAQLLSENSDLADAEHRMTEIIYQQSDRINYIIEDIMKISRGAPAAIEKIDLREWLDIFVRDFCQSNTATPECFDLQLDTEDSTILFDVGHLTQVMTNLCANAHIHGDASKPLHIKVYKDQVNIINIEISDEGPGIDQQVLDKIFEPFFTTSHQGAGLGLYIVDQLCQLNDATIFARRNVYDGTSFIINPRSTLSLQH